MLTDPIADFLTKLRNAAPARKERVIVPFSKLKKDVADLLVKRGFLTDVRGEMADGHPVLAVYLNLSRENISIRRISKPGQRIYVGHKDVRRVRNGMGLGIYSTSKGILSDSEMRHMKIGGEYLCEVY